LSAPEPTEKLKIPAEYLARWILVQLWAVMVMLAGVTEYGGL